MSKLKLTFSDLIVFLLGISIVVAPLITDQNNLPKGWELPKVYFLQIFSLVIITLIIIHKLIDYKSQKLKVKSQNIFIIITSAILIISSFLSTFKRSVETIDNPLLAFLSKLQNGLFVKMSIVGNEFRDQGLVTFIISIILFFLVRNYLTKRNWHFIAVASILSGLIQSFIAFHQYFDLKKESPTNLKEGIWIFGSFGQKNFYSGILLLGIVFCLYYIFRKNLLTRIYALVAGLIILAGLYISSSHWAFACITIAIVIAVSYELAKNKEKFYKVLSCTLIAFALLFIPIMNIFLTKFPEYKQRNQIWNQVEKVYIQQTLDHPTSTNIKLTLFGSGFDTLGDQFQKAKIFKGLYVDRADNIFFDTLSNVGLLGLVLLFLVLLKAHSNLKSNIRNPRSFYLYLALLTLLIRGLVHESSIINTYLFLLLLTFNITTTSSLD